MKICFLVLYYYLTFVHFQFSLYTLFGLHLWYMWFLPLIFCYTWILLLLYLFRGLVFFYKSIPSSCGCCLALVSSLIPPLLLVSYKIIFFIFLWMFLHWSILFFLFLITYLLFFLWV